MDNINGTLLTGIIIAAICFILLGIALRFGPTMLEGFESMRTADNVSEYIGLEETIGFGPTMILLGFIIAVGLGGFMGIGLAGLGVYKNYRK